jgi:hypothetical protein
VSDALFDLGDLLVRLQMIRVSSLLNFFNWVLRTTKEKGILGEQGSRDGGKMGRLLTFACLDCDLAEPEELRGPDAT